MSSLQYFYKQEVIAKLKQELQLSSVMAVPKFEKITLNMGVGQAANDKKILGFAIADMEKISGQKPLTTYVKKSVAGFKIREGWPLGCKVTLRRERMYEFLERLIHIAIPRVRDFRGLSAKGFDGRGNYSFGIQEQIIFPEISIEKVNRISGMDITFVTSAETDKDWKKQKS